MNNFHRISFPDRFSPTLLLTIVFASLARGPIASAEDWPEFRGPTGQGYASDEPTAGEWSESLNIAWKTPLDGVGWSSPVILGDQIWLTAGRVGHVVGEDDERLQERSPVPRTAADDLGLRAICVDRETGKVIHDVEILHEAKPDPIHTMNSFASPTAVIEPGRVYCHFGVNGTACLDTETGKVLWTNRDLKIDHQTGAGSSPVIWNDLLIVHCDGMDVQYIVALDKATGEIVWKTDRSGNIPDQPDFKKSFGTPIVLNCGGRDILLSPASNWLYAYDPSSGEEIWRYEYGVLGFSNVPRPVVKDDLLFLCTGFGETQMQALRLNQADATAEPELVWSYRKSVPNVASPIVVGDEIYFVADQGGVLTCLDIENGEVVWRERLGGSNAASLTYADGKLFIPNRQGDTYVVKPGRTFELLHKNRLDSGILASPAIVDGAIFMRTEKSLYRIELN